MPPFPVKHAHEAEVEIVTDDPKLRFNTVLIAQGILTLGVLGTLIYSLLALAEVYAMNWAVVLYFLMTTIGVLVVVMWGAFAIYKRQVSSDVPDPYSERLSIPLVGKPLLRHVHLGTIITSLAFFLALWITVQTVTSGLASATLTPSPPPADRVVEERQSLGIVINALGAMLILLGSSMAAQGYPVMTVTHLVVKLKDS